MQLTRKRFIEEINTTALTPETKSLLKNVVASYIDNCAGKDEGNYPTATPKQIEELQNDMNNNAVITCSVTLDTYEMLHFIYNNGKLLLKQWTVEDLRLFEKAETLSLTAHRAGNYHCEARDFGYRHPAIYPSFGKQTRYLIYKTTSDRNGINLFVKDPDGHLACIKHPKEGEYTLINVNPNMNIFEYWPAIEPIRKPDGSRAIEWRSGEID